MTDYEYGVLVIVTGPDGLGSESRNEAIEAAEAQGGELVPGKPVELTEAEFAEAIPGTMSHAGLRAFRFEMRRAAVHA